MPCGQWPGTIEHFGHAKQIPVLSCMNILIDTCVLKCMSGKKPAAFGLWPSIKSKKNCQCVVLAVSALRFLMIHL